MAEFDIHEPSAGARELARHCFDKFIALQKEGFTEDQALRIIGFMIRGASGGS